MAGGAAPQAGTGEGHEGDDAPSSATLRAVEHALDDVEVAEGGAQRASSPDAQPVLASPLAGGIGTGGQGGMPKPAGANVGGGNAGAQGGGAQQYWIDQSGNVIGTGGAPPAGPDGWMDPRMMGQSIHPGWMHHHMMGQQQFATGQQARGPPNQGNQGGQPQQQQMQGMMFPQQYPQQFQQQWMAPEGFQFQQMYPQHFQQQWLQGQYSGGGVGGYGRGGRRGYGRGGARGGYIDRETDENVQMFGRDAQDVPWSELVGSIAEFTMTQHGSIALQARIDSAGEETSDYVSTALKELAGSLADAMTNKYGSHLTRRIVELCSKEERTVIVREIAPQVVGISRSRFGTCASLSPPPLFAHRTEKPSWCRNLDYSEADREPGQ